MGIIKHWVRKLPNQTPLTERIADEHEQSQERIQGLEEQIRAVRAYMAELDAEAADEAIFRAQENDSGTA